MTEANRTEKSLKERWIEALRSGRYKQARGRLRKGDCFCCLGVLCDLYDPSGWEMPSGETMYRDSISYLPNEINRVSGITGNLELQLAEMNDSGRKSFAEIADWIEANL